MPGIMTGSLGMKIGQHLRTGKILRFMKKKVEFGNIYPFVDYRASLCLNLH